MDKVPEDSTCSICYNTIREPVLVECCGQMFCDKYLQKWLLKQRMCSHCRNTSVNYVKNHRMKQITDGSKIYYPNCSKGCEKIFTVGECSTHLETCLFVKVSCTNDCGVRMLRKELQDHTVSECLKRIVNSPY